jgi:hypothetical protein
MPDASFLIFTGSVFPDSGRLFEFRIDFKKPILKNFINGTFLFFYFLALGSLTHSFR